MEPFIGEIKMFGGNFAPRGYAFCMGQIVGIAQNTALFSLLGTVYGGNGQTTFGLPDLRGRSPVGQFQGPGLSMIDLGEVGGTENVTLLQTQMPMHTHVATGTSTISAAGTPTSPALVPSATNSVLGGSVGGAASAAAIWSTAMANPVPLTNPSTVNVTVQVAGGSQPVSLRNPFLGVNFIIAMEGVFPSRN
ncbi:MULTISPECIES: phage tail protein [unclassified Pseudomonas]|uniref:phage tail protein n=1 Tax=unclassified Pseudomonas TaxID=196821 RepID=UPI00211417F7|nr:MULTISPECIES: tail fiber protein [unclassified Pseudomonas]MDW3710572.1 tail fiber protein [Pseudomonas sp. 2023EL-01195]